MNGLRNKVVLEPAEVSVIMDWSAPGYHRGSLRAWSPQDFADPAQARSPTKRWP
jgi:hypothetical protein